MKLVASFIVLGLFVAGQAAKYPFIAWANPDFEKPFESSDAVNGDQALAFVKEAASSANSAFVALIVKDGMDSHDLIGNRNGFAFLKTKIAGKPHMYPNFKGFDAAPLAEGLDAQLFTVSNKEEIEGFAKAIKTVVAQSPAEGKTKYIVVRATQVTLEDLDSILKEVDTALVESGKPYLMAVSGNGAKVDQTILSFAQDPKPA